MKKNQLYILMVLIVAVVSLFSCNPVKHLHKGQQLYVGGDVKLKPPPKHAKSIRKDMEGLLRPKPNAKFLGMRPKLFLYNISKKPKGKGLNYLLHEKWGEPPVLASSLNLKANVKILQNHMQNIGFFRADVHGDSSSKNRKVTATYTIASGHRYTLDKITFPTDSLPVDTQIYRIRKATLLHPKDFYDLDNIKDERLRINDTLKNKGYFYFNDDDIIMKVDSTLGGKADVYVKVKPTTPPEALKTYAIHDINVYTNYTLNRDSALRRDTGYDYSNLHIIDPQHLYKPTIFAHSIFFYPGKLYTLQDHNLTLQRLVNLGTFKFVKVEFQRVDTPAKSGYLNTNIYLTPYKRRSIQFELGGNSRSNNSVGSTVNISWQDRNFFKGAELLKLNLSGGFETQVGGQQNASNTYSFSPGATLSIPQFVTPFNLFKTSRVAVPKTIFKADYEILNRKNYYTLNSFDLQAGYTWKENARKTHTLNIIDVTYVLPAKITDLFRPILERDPTLQQSFEKQFILGSSYNFEYTDQFDKDKKDNIYFNGHLDISGNLSGLLAGKHDSENPAKLFGVPFSQYVKIDGDIRNYLHLNHKGLTWANRLLAGFGYSYGNSRSIPFVKQFFIGGSNSIRGFRARTLGPGSFHTSKTGFEANEAGDIKLEASSELRANLISILKGAAFVDAGNIWLLRADSTKPGGKFHLNSTIKQLAVSAGVGLRFDLSLFVLRFDLAFPLCKPWLPEGHRWVLDQIDFGDKAWRKENLVLNIAIGYPF
ncbi:MAG TPA: BamA/TamA family outer membrane protein [Chitinophagaceae bacterium]|nr:BamA/TamA family outer membrane protein [Chitinophagaceae bacterium]